MLNLEQVYFERQGVPLLQNLTYQINTGELLQIRGANGSGKSTLLRLLASYLEPQAGHIYWQQKSIQVQRDTYQQQVCFVGHQNGVKPQLTVQENVRFIAALWGRSLTHKALNDLLQRLQLHAVAHVLASRLSAGQLRRLALIRLLLSSATIWLLDEPTTALDTAGQTLLIQLLQQHLAEQGLVIVATHHDLPLPQPMNILQLEAAHA